MKVKTTIIGSFTILFTALCLESKAQVLGGEIGNYLEINSISGKSGNNFFNKHWLVRDDTGNDWLTARLHDGISIDVSFLAPMSNTKTWWERDPYNNIQSWGTGTSSYLTINDGRVGVGTTSPVSRFAVVDPNNGWIMSSRAFAVESGQINGFKFFMGYPNENFKWAGIAAVTESLYSNSTGLVLYAGQTERIRIASGGNVGIGTSDPQAKLAVNGNILAKEVKVKTDISVPDYVFEPDYQKLSLSAIEDYVKANKHLPEVPSAKEINEEGLDLANMNMILLKKVEELTLHVIELQKEVQILKKQEIKNLFQQ